MSRQTQLPRSQPARARLAGQRGFTLVEIMVALLIGVFLIGGLLTIVQDNKRTFNTQNQLSQLQDAERMAMSLMTDVIQSTGYFPNPAINTASSLMPAAGALAQGQLVTGTYSAAAPGDTVTVRYATASGDGILNCSGNSNTSGAVSVYTNTFAIVVNGAGVSQLVCTMNGVAYPLVSGITNMSVLYGVSTGAATSNNVDTYMNATQVTAAGAWSNVISVLVQLTFTNPLYTGPGLGQTPTIVFQRDIVVMEATG